MKAVVGRRVFVGSVVAGLPLLAGAGLRAFGQDAGAAHNHPANTPDPVLEHIVRQLAAIHNRVRANGIHGEDARDFAAHLRTMVVYVSQTELDARIKSAVRQMINRDGRDATLYHERDTRATVAELRRLGFDVDPRQFDSRDADYATRRAALDALLAGGITRTLTQVATLLERAAPDLDRRVGRVVPVSLREDAAYWAAFCEELRKQANYLKQQAVWVCGAMAMPLIGEMFGPSCAAVEGSYLVIAAMMFVYGC